MEEIIIINTNYEDYFSWDIDKETGFRKLNLHIPSNFKTELSKFQNYNGEYKKCCKCKQEYPKTSYYFCGGGTNILHKQCKECEGHHFQWGRLYNTELNNKGFKYCSKCDRVLPLNEFFFVKSSGRCNTKTGFASNCKECNGRSFGFESINEHKDIFKIKDGFKVCQTCMLELPDTTKYFFSKKDRPFGSVRCKRCSMRHTDYGNLLPNISRKNELKENEAFCPTCHKIFDKKDLVIINGGNFGCRECYKSKNRYRYEKRRAKRHNTINDLTPKQWNDTLWYFDNKCVYCGMTDEESLEKYDKHLSQEHIIPLSKGGGYTKSNIIPACMGCNTSKSALSLIQFYNKSPKFTSESLSKINQFVSENTIEIKEATHG